MAFLKKNYQDIYEAMSADLRKRLPEITDFEQGSVVRSLLETIAFEQAVFYDQLKHVYDSAFVNTAEGINLEKVVAILDVHRNEPDYAIGEVTFYREDDLAEELIIPIGTQIVTEDNPDQKPVRKAYFTIEEAVLTPEDSSVTIKVQAELRGKEMETPRDTLIILPRPINGVKSVTNTEDINFSGKNRETDEELRTRAKKALLSAGRASETSIEQALLAMPNVLDVKIQEYADTTPGMIDVHVDGLTDENSQALFKRLDEVRAAGIYARLQAARLLKLSGTLKLIPHEDIIADELALLEKKVLEVVSKYVRSKKMGSSLSINQLTAEVLSIKGVKDLQSYKLTFRDSEIPYEYIDSPPANVGGIPNPKDHDIVLLLKKETQATSSTTEAEYEFKKPENEKDIFVSDYSRYLASELYIAASDKKLPIQVQIKINYPNENSTKAIKEQTVKTLKTLKFTPQGIKGNGLLTFDDKTATDISNLLNTFIDSFESPINDRFATYSIDPLGKKHRLFQDVVRAEVQDNIGTEQNPITSFELNETTLETAFLKIINEESDAYSHKEVLQKAIKNTVKEVLEKNNSNFPLEELQNLAANAITLIESEMAETRAEISELENKILNSRTDLLILNNKENPTAEEIKKIADLQKDIESHQNDQVQERKKQDELQIKANQGVSNVDKLVGEWKNKLVGKWEDEPTGIALTFKDQLENFTSDKIEKSDLDFSLRLRAVSYNGNEYYNEPIPVDFVETPKFDYLWVYSKSLRLVGTLKLDLPVTMSSNQKVEVYANVRNAINQILFNSTPEQDILVENILTAATNQEDVLGASFPENSLKLINAKDKNNKPLIDREIDKVISIKYSEKVLLSEDYFTIEDT